MNSKVISSEPSRRWWSGSTRMNATTAPRTRNELRRLTLRLAALIVLMSLIGLALFGWSLLRYHADTHRQRSDAWLREWNAAVSNRLTFSNSSLQFDRVATDPEVTSGYPSTWVLEANSTWDRDRGDDRFVERVIPDRQDREITNRQDVARFAMKFSESIYVEKMFNKRVRVVARAVKDGETPRAVVISVLDLSNDDASYASLRRNVIISSLLASALILFLGWRLVTLSLRPAVRALTTQEDFLANAAHELRTPVAALRAVAEDGLRDDETRPALERVAQLSVRASHVLDDLLTLARMDSSRMPVTRTRVRLDLLIEEVVADRSDVVFTGVPTVVEVDPSLVRLAVSNLIDNARRHGGAHASTSPIEVNLEGSSIAVSDGGPGIEPTVLPHVFDRFLSGRHSGGAGLGLAIVAWVARSHGGTAEAQNRVEGGARFTLHLNAPPLGTS